MMRLLATKVRLILIVLIAIVAISVFGAIYVNNQKNNTTYLQFGNLYADLFENTFKSNYEAAIFLFMDGDWCIVTNYESDTVHFPVDILGELKRKNLDLHTCTLIIHNHFGLCRFSDSDVQAYYYFKSHGFNGIFAIYCHANKQVFYLKKNDVHS
jgi:hypothetical protein